MVHIFCGFGLSPNDYFSINVETLWKNESYFNCHNAVSFIYTRNDW